MNTHWKAVLGTILIFILGGLSGVVVSSIYFHHRMIEFLQHPAATIAQATENLLTRNLSLDAGQKEQIHGFLMENLQQRKVLEQEIQPQVQAINRQTFFKIAAILRADQREHFQQNVTALRQRLIKNGLGPNAENLPPSVSSPGGASTNSAAGTPPPGQ